MTKMICYITGEKPHKISQAMYEDYLTALDRGDSEPYTQGKNPKF